MQEEVRWSPLQNAKRLIHQKISIMKKIVPLSLVILLLVSSCKKSSTGNTIPPGNPNNEMKAMVSVKGGVLSSFSAIGNLNNYGRITDPNGDKLISFGGQGTQGTIALILANISSPGVYTIGTIGGAGSQYIRGSFEFGNPFTGIPPYEFFSTGFTPPPAGTVTLDELTANSIKGSFSMICTGTIQITNGTFKGNF